MTRKIAIKTLQAIDAAIEADQGATYRGFLKDLMPQSPDAYDTKPPSFRSHLGASLIGRECSRELWYKFRWVRMPTFKAQILRLFNRGHLEEPRMLAALLAAGYKVYQTDKNGNQYRIHGVDKHFGSALDGVAIGIPDIPTGEPCYTEFKTHNKDSYTKLEKEGMRKTKPEHYVQMQQCMKFYKIKYGLYLATCKDNDQIYGEIITLDEENAAKYLSRAEFIIYSQDPPKRISENSSFFGCKFCDEKPVCFGKAAPLKNCRTCHNVKPIQNAQWVCMLTGEVIEKETQLVGCDNYVVHPLIKK